MAEAAGGNEAREGVFGKPASNFERESVQETYPYSMRVAEDIMKKMCIS